METADLRKVPRIIAIWDEDDPEPGVGGYAVAAQVIKQVGAAFQFLHSSHSQADCRPSRVRIASARAVHHARAIVTSTALPMNFFWSACVPIST